MYSLDNVKDVLNGEITLENIEPSIIDRKTLIRPLGKARLREMMKRLTTPFNPNLPVYVRKHYDDPERYQVVEGNHRIAAMRRIKTESSSDCRIFKVFLLNINDDRLTRG